MSVKTGSILPRTRAWAWRSGALRIASPERPLRLRAGGTLEDASVAFETFGDPSAETVVLVCHALTGDAHVTRAHEGDRPGWWETLVGEGRAIDPARHCIVCANVLGGCAGSTGPTSIDPATGRAFGPDFPEVSIEDMVEAHARLLAGLGVDRPVFVVGGSIGGFQALEWALRFPERTRGAAVIAAGASLSAFGLAFNAVGRNAVLGDARFRDGRYPADDPPASGLAVARQLAHLTYRAAPSFERRFGRQQGAEGFEVASYLAHKGRSFVGRFDANAYLALTRAMDAYDAGARLGDGFARLARAGGRLLAVGYSSDWLFPAAQSIRLADAARAAGVRASARVIDTEEGHDAFLMPGAALGEGVAALIEDGVTR